MKKVIKKRKRSNNKKIQKGAVGNIFIFGVLILLTVAAFNVIGGIPSTSSPQTGTPVQIATPAQGSSHNVLQLETFGYTTPAPTPFTSPQPITSSSPLVSPPADLFPTTAPNAPVCANSDDGVIVPPTCRCPDLTMVCVNGQELTETGAPLFYGPFNLCGRDTDIVGDYQDNGRYCVGKPVIYLYPTSPTYVNVQVITSGNVVVSNPHYPQGGWQNILAYPNGSLQYQNQIYTELFYESSVNTFQKPEQGIIIPTAQLTEKLNNILGQLGLIGNEKKEFLAFWVPRLQTLHSSYIFFSLLSSSAKEGVDHVIITPKPDTQISFIAYFKPVDNPNYGSALQLPQTPQRKGFTSVEWGGVVDK